MFTEEEARAKQCRISGMIEIKNRTIFPKCIASECMGWVVTSLPIPETFSIVTGHRITLAQPGHGVCGYARR